MGNKEQWINHKIQIEILTPVIINTGEYYEYGELFLLGDKLYKVNLNNLLKIMDLQTRTEYIETVTKGISSRDKKYDKAAKALVLKTLRENNDKISLIFSRPMGYLQSGKNLIENKPFQIIDKNCIKKINDKPYIPGSSIKGSLRTAIIQSLLNHQTISKNDYIDSTGFKRKYVQTKKFESKIMKVSDKVTDDPFKYIKVSDFEFESKSSVNILGEILISTKKDPLPVYTTMTEASCYSDSKITLTGTISISTKLKKIYSLEQFTNINNIIDALNDYYIDNFNNKAKQLPIGPRNLMVKIIEDNVTSTKGLIRIGRFSGIENITYNIQQDMSINTKIYNEDINIEGGESYPLIENKFLPGYCLITEVRE